MNYWEFPHTMLIHYYYIPSEFTLIFSTMRFPHDSRHVWTNQTLQDLPKLHFSGYGQVGFQPVRRCPRPGHRLLWARLVVTWGIQQFLRHS